MVPTDHRRADAVTYRTATVDDVRTVLSVWDAAGVHPTTTDDADCVTTLVTRDDNALLVAESDGRMVGTLIVGWDGWRGNMYRLAVVPDLRRRGIAAALVRRGEDRLRALGGRRVAALVVDGDDRAADFWRSVHYEPYAMGRYVRTLGPPEPKAGALMVTWAEFETGAGPLAALARDRVEGPGLVLLGTLRRDGRPRISPVEPLIYDGRLYLGMMWHSMKALDLRRDGRCVVHSLVTGKEGTEGDIKLYGRALEISDPDERRSYGEALLRAIGWQPTGDFHLFALDIDEVGYFRVEGAGHRVWHWRPGDVLGPLETRPGAS